MIGTPTLHQLAHLADQHDWRVVLVGDPRQLQAVGRGGLFREVCATGRVHELATIHRFTNRWEAAALLKLRHGDPSVFDTYEATGGSPPGASTVTSSTSPTPGPANALRAAQWPSLRRATPTWRRSTAAFRPSGS